MKFISGKPITRPDLKRVVNRFFLTLILNELWQYKPVHEVADQFHMSRGVVQNLVTASAAYASSVVKFCEELPEYWAFKELLTTLTKRLSYCCSLELIPLMELPCVKLVSVSATKKSSSHNFSVFLFQKKSHEPNNCIRPDSRISRRWLRQRFTSSPTKWNI